MDTKTQEPGLIPRLQAWAMHPLAQDIDLLGLALTVVFVATVVFLYCRFLSYVTETE
jgi:hypothetical protein